MNNVLVQWNQVGIPKSDYTKPRPGFRVPPGSLVMGLDWSGDVTWTEGGTAIIRGDEGDLEPNEGDST